MRSPEPTIAPGRLVPLAGASAGLPPLFLVHAIGGTVHTYAALARCLSDRYAVYGIEAFGIRDDEPVDVLAEIVERYVAGVREVQPHGPYRLAGWSMGGIVAFEMARLLEGVGEAVSFVALMDSPVSLSWADLGYVEGDRSLLVRFTEDVADSLGWRLPDGGAAQEDPLGWLASTIAGGTAAEVVQEELECRFAVFRAHARALAQYRPSGPVDAELRVLIPDDSPNLDSAPRWPSHARGGSRLSTVRGDHYTFLRPPVVNEVAAFVGAPAR
ncbi:alpha/beta fold hydrolase [Streptomyces virginiae]|uniref:thioesterase domain-containing protein n=1 Tax=Streptomyces virginiae TaxID=1961 RepID=UPI0036EC75E3